MKQLINLLLVLLMLLAFLSGAPAMAQHPVDPVPMAATAPVDPPTSQVTLVEAVRSASKRDATHKGRPLLVWVRQSAAKHLKVTVR